MTSRIQSFQKRHAVGSHSMHNVTMKDFPVFLKKDCFFHPRIDDIEERLNDKQVEGDHSVDWDIYQW
eukprot:CAMPEP_0185745140 /NCGR_PEP_ID=MMETSP1174-20130828/3409_1 /TAXON_ID=35687 /ORGANISM="Dictyocha speculum, Strain CCMP1381" /LENGTH=66 /DNA_ID=CAMNT_0028418951 /DNA_START=381 /DNA_END=581 /DNA_ORIENTATION=-